ncbi:MAG: alcohol dehydrogenase [Candidatus Auribacter fodinae]|jgi:threonine dehydrogenase-like Zn-dependent dehydrogenase|uniref:Alcohol dehydrogenase n=1 Tax=Candidatus Auribacter fodinae TaxID=2093366 RepID=A0A3A4QS46_9BACT|nr:MAG: alcohol dehydrogenase [Candidatus Auribacter fodinae]
MRALVLSDGKLRLANIDKPIPAQNECLIKILCAGICNTDIELLRGYMGFNGVPGHEFVGQIITSSDPKLMGKRVVGEINIGCGACSWCRSGNKEHCPARSVLGILNKNGVFAEYITLPAENLHVVPESISNEQAVFTEPLAAAIRIVQQVHLNPEDKIAIIGDGKLGLLIAQVLQSNTIFDFTLFGRHPERTDQLKSCSAIKIVTNYESNRYHAKFDAVIEASGTQDGFLQAINMLKPLGHLILKSTVAEGSQLNLAPIVINELTVTGSRCGPFAPALRMLENGSIHPENMISAAYSLDNWEEAFKTALKKGVLKVVLTP